MNFQKQTEVGGFMKKELVTLIAVLFLFSVFNTFAVSKTWNGPEGGKWYHPSNWDPPGVPSFEDNVIIPYGAVVDISNAICIFDYMDNWGTLVVDSTESATFVRGGPIRNHHKIICLDKIVFQSPEIYNGTEAKIVISKEVDFFADVIENEGFIGFDSTEIEEWDTTSPNFMRLTFLKALKNAGEISWPDNIEIQSDSVSNDSGATIESGKSISISAENFENRGDITTDENLYIYTKKRLYNGGGMSITEFLEREYAGHMRFTCWNPYGDAQFINDGEIFGGAGRIGEQGDHIFVEADNFTNAGTVSPGAGGSGSTSGMFDVVAKLFINAGNVHSTGDSRGSMSPLDSPPGNIWITADQIDLNMPSGIFSGNDVQLWGRAINVDLGSTGGIFGSTLVDFRTTNSPTATADFSSTTVADAIQSLSLIRIVSNNLIQPVVGINTICDPDPVVSTGSISYSFGHIFAESVIETTATNDSILITIRNSSSNTNTLRTVVNSILGWVISDTDTFYSLDPWECRSFFASYSIPSGLHSTTSDTISISLYLNEGAYPSRVLRPTITYIPLETGSVGVGEINKPEALSLSAHPNPFNSAVTIGIDNRSESSIPLSTIEIFDVNGRIVDNIAVGTYGIRPGNVSRSLTRTDRGFVWRPDISIPSGVYLVRASFTEGTVLSARITYLK